MKKIINPIKINLMFDVIDKNSWCSTRIISENELYTSKIIEYKSGNESPMLYHLYKDKTLYIQSGIFECKWVDLSNGTIKTEPLTEGDVIRFLPGQPHQLIAESDCVIIEVSTQNHKDDIYYISELSKNKSELPERGHVYHTLGNKIIDLRDYDYNKSQRDVENEYGWEACMYWSNIHNNELEGHFKINKGDVFVDLGSNIGMSATYAELKGASLIYCVEPDPFIFKCLEKNSGDNWVLDNVAISKTNNPTPINVWPSDEKILVKSINFNDYVSKHKITKIDYLKIDIEGAEYDLIESISDENWGIINKVFLEYHEDVFEFSDEKRSKLIQTFVDKGLINYHVHIGTQSLLYFWR